MRRYHYVAYFFGAHSCECPAPSGQRDLGTRLPEPFCIAAWSGLVSATVNVLWGLFNLAIGYLLVCRVGNFNLRKTSHMLVLGAGIVFMSLMLARTFARFHGGM